MIPGFRIQCPCPITLLRMGGAPIILQGDLITQVAGYVCSLDSRLPGDAVAGDGRG